MGILQSESHEGVIEWLPNGDGFAILDKKKCLSEILFVHFGISKYASFTRRLNRWNFIFHQKGNKSALYFHPLFCRDSPSLCMKMAPKPQKNYNQKYRRKVNEKNAHTSYSNLHSSTTRNGSRTFGSIAEYLRPVVTSLQLEYHQLRTIPQDGCTGYFSGTYQNASLFPPLSQNETSRMYGTQNTHYKEQQQPMMTSHPPKIYASTYAYPESIMGAPNSFSSMYDYGPQNGFRRDYTHSLQLPTMGMQPQFFGRGFSSSSTSQSSKSAESLLPKHIAGVSSEPKSHAV
jgi:hypothetical protein